MAKLSKRVTLKNVLVDSAELEGVYLPVEEIDKEGSNTYNLAELLMQFADVEGVSISIGFDESIGGIE